MKKVFVCSPFAGNVELNIQKAREYCRIEMMQGNVPFAPHLLYPQFLNDNDPTEREQGLRMGLEIMKCCDELHVYGPTISNGMAREIAVWREMGRIEKRLEVSILIKSLEPL